jgi:hypothetical protein
MSNTLNQTTVTEPITDDPKKTPDGGCCSIPPGGGDPGPGITVKS